MIKNHKAHELQKAYMYAYIHVCITYTSVSEHKTHLKINQHFLLFYFILQLFVNVASIQAINSNYLDLLKLD